MQKFLILAAITLEGCALIPNEKLVLESAQGEASPIKVVSAQKVLSDQKSEKLINKLTPDQQTLDALKDHLQIEQSLSENALYTDNNVYVLFNGDDTLNAMFSAIGSAKQHINLEYFIFENVKYDGTTLDTLLKKKLSEGVKVNIIYDAVGSINTPKALFDALKDAGAKITEYNPIALGYFTSINNRDHRKILVVDGKLAIVGGVNLSKTYQSHGSLKSFSKKQPLNLDSAKWRDTDLVIKGPVVEDIQKTFLTHWSDSIVIDKETFFPKLEKQGQEIVRVIPTPANKEEMSDSAYYLTLLSALNNAEKSIVLNSAYFVPTKAQKKAILAATQRGVKVEILLPGVSDSNLAINVQHSHYDDLLEMGVNIYEVNDEVLHAKMVTIDGIWSVVGSSNFDFRSAGLNAEIDFVILGTETSNELKNKFEKDISSANKIELAEWRKRPVLKKIKEKLSRLFQGVL